MKQEFPEYDLVYGGASAKSSPGDFDQVYYNKKTDEFIVVEAKGGSADVGAANTKFGRSQQGTRRYNDYIIYRMKNSGDAVKKKIAEDLEMAIEIGNVKFYKAQTPIKNGKVQDTILTEFIQ